MPTFPDTEPIIWLLMLSLWFLASFSSVMHDCTVVVANKKNRVFSLLHLYKQEFDWINIQLIEVPDR